MLAFVLIRGLGVTATMLTVGEPSAAIFVWGIPIAAILGTLAIIFRQELPFSSVWRLRERPA